MIWLIKSCAAVIGIILIERLHEPCAFCRLRDLLIGLICYQNQHHAYVDTLALRVRLTLLPFISIAVIIMLTTNFVFSPVGLKTTIQALLIDSNADCVCSCLVEFRFVASEGSPHA